MRPPQLASLVACVAVAGTAAAQPADVAIHGRVVDEAGSPIAGAAVMLGDETAVTDDDGRFAITGDGTLTVIAQGHRSVAARARAGMVVRMVRADGEVIEVTGKAPDEAKPVAYTLSAADVASTPGAMNDALRAITVLPAASRIPFSFGGVVLRGMSPRDSSVFIDGVKIPIAFHFGGLTGVFPTQALDAMRVVPSGFDVSMGRTQGGVVELETRTPRGDAYRLGGEVSLLHSLASAEGPLGHDGAFLLTLRRSYLDVLATPLVDRNDPLPSYSDGQFRAVWGDVEHGQLAAYAFGSLDRIANSEDAAAPNDPDAEGHVAANLGFVRTGASYKRKFGKSLVTVAPSLGTNVLSLKTVSYEPMATVPSVVDVSRRWYLFGGRAEWLHDDAHGTVRAGLDVSGGWLGRVDQHAASGAGDDVPLPRNTVLWTDAAVWLETRRQLGERVSVRPGVRIDRFGLGNQTTFDPRINAQVAISPISTVRASLGRFHQPPSPAHFDEFADNLAAKSSYVDQATLALEVAPSEGLLASIVAFDHEGKKTLVDIQDRNIRPTGIGPDLVLRELLEDQLGLYAYQANVGRQRTYGLEGSLGFEQPGYRMLANLSWSHAERTYDPALGGGWQLYGLDQPVRVNLLFATAHRQWNFGARLAIASGNPVNVVPAGTPAPMDGAEAAAVLQRLPTFSQLDVRVSRTWKKPWGETVLFFDIQNVTNHRNVEIRESNLDENNIYRYRDVPGLPIIPYIGVEFAPR